MEAPGYWDDPEKSQEGMKELKNLKDEAEDYHALEIRSWFRRYRRSWRPLRRSWIP